MSSVPTSFAAHIVLASLLFGGETGAAAAAPLTQSIPEVASIVKARDGYRGLVLDVKERFKPSDPEYRHARELYRAAYGSYDAWITVLAAGIVAGSKQDLRADKTYKEVADAAGLAGAKFSGYVEDVMGASRSVSLASVVELGIKIWLSWRDAALKDRKELADYIAGHTKWDSWESIKAEAESPATKPSSSKGLDSAAPQAGSPPSSPPERWALIAGVGTYEDRYIHPLHGDADAVDFATALRDRAGFPADHIVLLAGQDAEDCHLASIGRTRKVPAASEAHRDCRADRANLVNNLYAITKLVPPNGLFAFYFSGHGRYVDGESLLYPSDVKNGDETFVKQQALSARTLAAGIHSNHIKQVLIFLDACRDQFLVTKGAQDERTSPEFARGFDLGQLNSEVDAFMTFFSSSEGSASYEDPHEKRSYFTAELVRALNGEPAAYDARKLLTLESLIHYVETRVRNRVQEERRASQVPDAEIRGFRAGELVLAPLP